MQREISPSVSGDVVEGIRQELAGQVLGGDSELTGMLLVGQRLTDSRFSPPELWQHAADVLISDNTEHTRFEHLAVARAVDVFSQQFLLLKLQMRQQRLTELTRAARPFPSLRWRLKRLGGGVDVESSALPRLESATRQLFFVAFRLLCLPPQEAAREGRLFSARVANAPKGLRRFETGVLELRRLVAGIEPLLSATDLKNRVQERCVRSQNRHKPGQVAALRSRTSNSGRGAVPRSSGGAGSWAVLAFVVFAVIRIVGSFGSANSNSSSYSPPPRYSTPRYSAPSYNPPRDQFVSPYQQPVSGPPTGEDFAEWIQANPDAIPNRSTTNRDGFRIPGEFINSSDPEVLDVLLGQQDEQSARAVYEKMKQYRQASQSRSEKLIDPSTLPSITGQNDPALAENPYAPPDVFRFADGEAEERLHERNGRIGTLMADEVRRRLDERIQNLKQQQAPNVGNPGDVYLLVPDFANPNAPSSSSSPNN